MAQLDKKLPDRKSRHRRAGRVEMIDSRWLLCEFRCGYADVFGVSTTPFHQVVGEADHGIDLIANTELRNLFARCRDYPRHVGAKDQRKGCIGSPFGR